LIELEEAELKFNQQIVLNQPDPEIAQKIRKMVKNPTTVRISDPRTAEFVLELQKKFGFGSVAEAIRYCIETVRENEDTFYKDLVSAEQRKAEHEEDKAVKEEFQQAYEAEVNMGEEPNTGKKLDLEVDREAAEKAAKELEEQPAKDEDEEDWNF
jgi:lipid II:glycine glycyltransferase (peptidoglycan interpeptide bridge formation enzyme)